MAASGAHAPTNKMPTAGMLASATTAATNAIYLCAAADMTYRVSPVPALSVIPDDFFIYDYQCPEDMFVTRVFGRAGTYVETMTAQCARSWNLNSIGVPYLSLQTPPFTHTSVEGYSGIMIKSHSGGVDCISLITTSGTVSPVFGATNIPGTPTVLSCTEGDKIVGFYGHMSQYVETIGIICSSGAWNLQGACQGQQGHGSTGFGVQA